MSEIKNKNMPLLSVIIPIYNVEKYLPACIESIMHQTYRNLEIILVDDGSTDSCGAICDEYKNVDNRIKVIHKDRAGQGWARNSGMEIAEGELFGFVDSDDVVLPQMYEILVKLFLKHGVTVAACTRVQIGEEDEIPDTYFDIDKELAKSELFTGHAATKELLQSHWKFKNAVWEKLYRRELFKNTRFRSVYAEDREIMYKLLYASDKVAYIPLKLYGYRLREGSTMLSSWNDHKDNMVYEQDYKCMKFFKDRGENELYDAAVYWHFLWGIENYRRLEGQDSRYRMRLKREMAPYAKLWDIFKTDYPLRRKIEFYIFGKFPELHYKVCNVIRTFKGTGGIRI